MNEQELFKKLKEYYLPDLQKTSGIYDSYDCFSIQQKCFIELKCRKSHYENLMIEQIKYARVKYEALERSWNPLYICSTPQGVWAFNLNNFEPEWKDQTDLPTTTEFENKTKRTKSVGFLPINKGNKLSKFLGDQ